MENAPACRRSSPLPLSIALALLVLAPLVPGTARGQADVTGEWRTLPYTTPINPIHVALLRTGKVLIAAGSENDPTQTIFRAAVFDPRTGTFAPQNVPWDLFCNAMSQLADGRILVTGGNLQYNPFRGVRTTTIFDPVAERFIQVQDMARGRWYPSNALLPDGRTMTFSGWLDTGGVPNEAVEIYDVGTGWSPQHLAPFSPPLYPWLHLLPNGRVFFSGSTPSSHLFDPATRTWTTSVARTNYNADRKYGSSVLLPLSPQDGYRPRILIMGGHNPATATAEVIDLSASSPRWRSVPSMSGPRIEMNAVLLPTGKVVALGGSARDNDASTATLDADLFDPETETWSSAGRNAIPRLYHSVALLLPDATVWVAGSNPYQGTWENRMEIYAPAYLFTRNASGQLVSAPRPSIASAPARIGYDAAFSVGTSSAADIGAVVLVRPGSATHGFDFDQRLVRLDFTGSGSTLSVTSPPNANVAPPGYYMLFLLDRNGVPSVARFLQLTPTPTNAPPDAQITNPSADVTIRAGESVTFAGTGTDGDGSIARYSWVFPGGTPRTSAVATPGSVIFNQAGTYVVSLTVVDDRGENDPSPATRTITVEPAGFSGALTNPPNGATVNGVQTVGMVVTGGGSPSYTYTLRVDGTEIFTQTTAETSTTFNWNTATVADGAHTLSLTVRDGAGQTFTVSHTVTVANAAGALRVAITGIRNGDVVQGTVWATIWIDGDVEGPFNYRLTVGGTTVDSGTSSNKVRSLAWDTRLTGDGPRTLTATVSNATQSGSASVSVTVQNGGGGGPAPLTASIASPAQGATVSGTTTVSLSTSGGTPNYTFTLRIDGAVVLSQSGPGTSASYSWDTRTYANGSHTLELTVADAGGQTATATRTVTVSNTTAPSPLSAAFSSPSEGATVGGTVSVAMTAAGGTPGYTYTLRVGSTTVFTQSTSATSQSYGWNTTTVANGSHTLSLTVTDGAGQTATATRTVTVSNTAGGGGGGDPLTIYLTSPSAGSTVSGTVWANVWVGQPYGTAPYRMVLSAAGATVWEEMASTTHKTLPWETFRTPNGTQTLTATVTDAAGRSGSASVTVTVQNAGTPLAAGITSPANGATVSGTVAVAMTATGGTPGYTYTLRVNTATVFSQATSATSQSYSWNTATVGNGSYTLALTVTDATGQSATTNRSVTVSNTTAPAPLSAGFSSPGEGATVSGTVSVAMTAAGGTPGYTYTLRVNTTTVFTQSTTATSQSYGWDTTSLANGSHTLSLALTDGAGQTATATRTVTVSNGTAPAPLTAQITSPGEGATVSGTVAVGMTVSGGTPSYGYVLRVNGTTLFTRSTRNASQSYNWNTTSVADGSHTLSLTITDSAGQTVTTTRTVTVRNSSAPPPLSAGFTSPSDGATVSGTVSVAMTAGGGTPAYTYTLRVNGTTVLTQSTSATSQSYSWNTTALANGSHTLSLTLTDSGGQSATATRTVTVSNTAGGTLTIHLTSPSAGSTVSGTVWANVWVGQPYGTAPYRMVLSAAGATVWEESTSNTHKALPWETFRTPNGTQTLTVTVTDAAGRTGSASVTVIVQNSTSGPAPLAAGIASPASGATVSGTVSVSMTASGGTPGYTYALRVNTTTVFTQSSSATSQTYSWNTTSLPNGSHTLSLTVTDTGGQTATTSRTVTVSNSTAGSGGTLTVYLTSPSAGSTVSGTVWANVWIGHPPGTAPYVITLSAAGATVWEEGASTTHKALPWETFRTPNGAQTLTATVRDAEGRVGSASVSVIVQNP